MSFRPKYHEVLTIADTEFDEWKEIIPPARYSYAINKFTFFHNLCADQNISVRKVIAEKKETYIENAPFLFFMPDQYVAGVPFPEPKNLGVIADATAVMSTLANGEILEGCLRGIPDYKLPSPICVNPNEKLQLMVSGTTPTSGNTHLVVEGKKFIDQHLIMRLLPYITKLDKALVSAEKTKIVEITPDQFPLVVQTFAIDGMDFAEGDLYLRKGLYEEIDTLKIGTEIHEAPLTSLERMYQLNEKFDKGEKFILEALATSTATLSTYLFAYWIP